MIENGGPPTKGNGYTAAQFIEAIPGTGGIISRIARKVGCSWHTAQKYIRDMPTIAAAYADECETVTDLAETTVIKAIQDGDVGTARWYLSTKGKSRGYAERHEVTFGDGDLDAAIEAELAKLAAGRKAAAAGAAEKPEPNGDDVA